MHLLFDNMINPTFLQNQSIFMLLTQNQREYSASKTEEKYTNASIINTYWSWENCSACCQNNITKYRNNENLGIWQGDIFRIN